MYMNRAISRKALKDYARAIEDLNLVIEHAPSVQAWFLRADVKALAGNIKAAEAERSEGMKLQPTTELDWSTRGYARESASRKRRSRTTMRP